MVYSDSLRNHNGDGSVCFRVKQKCGDVRGLYLERHQRTSGRTSVRKEPKTSTVQGISNVESGMMCTDENDIEELTGIFGLLCYEI